MTGQEMLLDSLRSTQIEERAEQLGRLAKTAAVLSGDDNVEKSAAHVIKEARKKEILFSQTADQIAELVNNLENRVKGSAFFSGSEKDDESSYHGERDELSQQLNQAANDLSRMRADVVHELDAEEHRVREILAEHDYINLLLRGTGSATDKQFDVMAFPRNSSAKTNVLQVSGGAGTGKTLCLLAKLIQDTRPSRQMGLLPEKSKHGLFVCFNKALRTHVAELLARIPDAARNIEVVSFDQFVNQLVRATPSQEFAHLASYAARSRYPSSSQDRNGKFWALVYSDDIQNAIGVAMQTVRANHVDQSERYYLNYQDSANVEWMSDEIAWLEARYENPVEAASLYPTAERRGRGTEHLPDANIRLVILEIWSAYRQILEQNHQYTMEQATKRLLADPNLPKYDAIAIDEAQDLTVASVKLLVRMRSDEQSRVYICGDENQKIYKRDFTWSELDEGIHGHTITLDANKRNSVSIEAFANRLLGIPSTRENASDLVFVGEWSGDSLMRLVGGIQSAYPMESTVVISANPKYWFGLARAHGISATNPKSGGVLDPGLYIIGEMGGKGLEFDNVIVDCSQFNETDESTLKNMLYVNCTRARKRLYLRYAGEPHEIIRRYYADFL